ncbi:MAG: hypothetical protein ACKV1O_18445 [Saprospiraceae bacterium]
MTRLILEISNQSDLEMLLPLLKQLKIKYSNIDPLLVNQEELEEAIAAVSKGCDMGSFGDALEYQINTRRERSLPFRD